MTSDAGRHSAAQRPTAAASNVGDSGCASPTTLSCPAAIRRRSIALGRVNGRRRGCRGGCCGGDGVGDGGWVGCCWPTIATALRLYCQLFRNPERRLADSRPAPGPVSRPAGIRFRPCRRDQIPMVCGVAVVASPPNGVHGTVHDGGGGGGHVAPITGDANAEQMKDLGVDCVCLSLICSRR